MPPYTSELKQISRSRGSSTSVSNFIINFKFVIMTFMVKWMSIFALFLYFCTVQKEEMLNGKVGLPFGKLRVGNCLKLLNEIFIFTIQILTGTFVFFILCFDNGITNFIKIKNATFYMLCVLMLIYSYTWHYMDRASPCICVLRTNQM